MKIVCKPASELPRDILGFLCTTELRLSDSEELMDSGLRKRFSSPFSISKTTERSKINPISSSLQQEQCSTQPPTPRLLSGAQISKTNSIMNSGRSQEKILKPMIVTLQSTLERGPRQKVSRSLFSVKPRDVEQQFLLEQQSLSKQQFYSEKEQICKKDSLLRSDFPGTDNKRTSISLAELAVPELLPGVHSIDIASNCIPSEALLGSCKEVEVWRPCDFHELLKSEAVEKFKLAISPTKFSPPHFTSLSCSSIKPIIDDLDFHNSGTQATRLLKEKEKFVQMQDQGEPKSTDFLTAMKRANGGSSGVLKSEAQSSQEPSLGQSIFSGLSIGKRRMIRGFRIPRCGRLTNQSYQEQSKEFQEILSSKVRQIAEVADCLQHKEPLYDILQF